MNNKGIKFRSFIVFIFALIILNILTQKVNATAEADYIYLSDTLQYNSASWTNWGKIQTNKNIDGGTITLLVDGEQVNFKKGISAHATSAVFYDVSEYNKKYTKLSLYMGIDYSQRGKGNGVYFSICGTNDETADYTKKDWDKPENILYNGLTANNGGKQVLTADGNAIYIEIDISNCKYIRLRANDNGANGNDHAVYADARLMKTGFDINSEKLNIKKVSEYDSEIKAKGVNAPLNDELKTLLLKRTFVSRYGYQNIQNVAKESDTNKEALEYILNDFNVLEYFVTAGEKDGGNYTNILNTWCDLYKNKKSDWANYKTDNEQLALLKTAIALSVVNSQGITFWTGGGGASEPLQRYEIYKLSIKNGKFNFSGNGYDWSVEKYRDLPMELMRWVVNNKIHDDEILWLQDYSESKSSNISTRLSAYTYIVYTYGFNYNEDKYYDINKKEEWNDMYKLDKIRFADGRTDLKYGTRDYHRLWMVFNRGSVCGGLAKTYANLRQSWGIPAAVIGQPGHAATLGYKENEKGVGTWELLNDVSGWQQSEKGERLPLGWGSQSWDSYYSVSYILLAQHALNNYNKGFEESLYYNYLSAVYSDSVESKIKVYDKALEKANYNVDAYIGKIRAYNEDKTKTKNDYYALAQEISNNLTYFPLPMYDLLEQIRNKIIELEKAENTQVNGSLVASIDGLRKRTLETAKTATSAQSLQNNACKKMAEYLLGQLSNQKFATFSFDGDDAGYLVIDDTYLNSIAKYTISGYVYNDVKDESGKVVSAEIAPGLNGLKNGEFINGQKKIKLDVSKINEEDNIIIRVQGATAEDITQYTIDITKPTTQNSLQVDDINNVLVGDTTALQYKVIDKQSKAKIVSEEDWKDYIPTTDKVVGTKFEGNQTIIVRYKAHGTFLQSDESTKVYEFHKTPGEKDSDLQYVDREYLTSNKTNVTVSSVEKGKEDIDGGDKIFDGKADTKWHNTWSGEAVPYIEVKFEDEKLIAGIEYQPRTDNCSNGRFKKGKVYGKVEDNWIELTSFDGFENNGTLKVISIPEEKITKVTGIKIVIEDSYADDTVHTAANKKLFASAVSINFYEKIVKEDKPNEDKPTGNTVTGNTITNNTVTNNTTTGNTITNNTVTNNTTTGNTITNNTVTNNTTTGNTTTNNTVTNNTTTGNTTTNNTVTNNTTTGNTTTNNTVTNNTTIGNTDTNNAVTNNTTTGNTATNNAVTNNTTTGNTTTNNMITNNTTIGDKLTGNTITENVVSGNIIKNNVVDNTTINKTLPKTGETKSIVIAAVIIFVIAVLAKVWLDE